MTEKLYKLLEFKDYIVLGNPILSYIKALALFILLFLIFKITGTIFISRLKKLAKKTKTDLDDAIISIVNSIRPSFYLIIALWISAKYLNLSILISRIVDASAILIISRQISFSFKSVIDYISSKKEGRSSQNILSLISLMGRVIFWSVVLLVILSIFGIDITAIVAGLGIGGIALALAVQNILGDLLSSISIYLDKPFLVGDFVKIGDKLGTVMNIGIKTTRILSVNGEEIVFPNSSLVSSVIQNFGKIERRRSIIKIGVEYSTEMDKLKKIPEIVKGIVESVDLATFDRCHLSNFGDSALEFELVYYVESSDYMDYMNANQEIMIKIKEEFDKEGIEFAFPSETIYLRKDE